MYLHQTAGQANEDMDHLVKLLSDDSTGGTSHSILSHNDKQINFHGKKSNVSLQNNGILIIQHHPFSRNDVLIVDLIQTAIGINYITKCQKSGKAHCLDIYCYDFLKKTCFKSASKRRKRIVYSLEFNNNNEVESLTWRDTLSTFLQKPPGSAKPYLVIINPISGSGQSLRVWEKVVQPMFHEACISSKIMITTHADHAKEYMETTMQPNEYDAIVCIGVYVRACDSIYNILKLFLLVFI
jgi:hypothetical protein